MTANLLVMIWRSNHRFTTCSSAVKICQHRLFTIVSLVVTHVITHPPSPPNGIQYNHCFTSIVWWSIIKGFTTAEHWNFSSVRCTLKKILHQMDISKSHKLRLFTGRLFCHLCNQIWRSAIYVVIATSVFCYKQNSCRVWLILIGKYKKRHLRLVF